MAAVMFIAVIANVTLCAEESTREPNVPPEGFTALFNDPEIGVWHTAKLTMQGRTLSAEYDGEVLYDGFTYPDWMMNLEPAPIRLQKHVFFDDDNALGKMNPCPIEYRNISIKDVIPPSQDKSE